MICFSFGRRNVADSAEYWFEQERPRRVVAVRGCPVYSASGHRLGQNAGRIGTGESALVGSLIPIRTIGETVRVGRVSTVGAAAEPQRHNVRDLLSQAWELIHVTLARPN